MSNTVLKIVCSDWINASRDKRELSTYRGLGDRVIVMAKGSPKDSLKKDFIDGFDVYRFSTRPLGDKIPANINRVFALFVWAHKAGKFNAEIISGHDLTGLLIGWMSNLFKPNFKKARLIYDSHEFEIGRNTDGNRGKIVGWLIAKEEKFLMKRCAFSIMVNDSIADEVQKMHHLRQRPVVVRNIAPHWERDEAECRRIRSDFCTFLHVPEDTFWVMYHGGVMINRGVENMLNAIAQIQGIAGVVLGNGNEYYITLLKQQAKELGIADRVLFYSAVPVDILKNYVGAVDCGLITIPNVCMSYYYGLPNKFFENIQSETPVIGSNFPEIRRLIDKYSIGLLCDPSKPEEIAACIKTLQTDKDLYRQFKENLKVAKEELCWENEKQILKATYEGIGL